MTGKGRVVEALGRRKRTQNYYTVFSILLRAFQLLLSISLFYMIQCVLSFSSLFRKARRDSLYVEAEGKERKNKKIKKGIWMSVLPKACRRQPTTTPTSIGRFFIFRWESFSYARARESEKRWMSHLLFSFSFYCTSPSSYCPEQTRRFEFPAFADSPQSNRFGDAECRLPAPIVIKEITAPSKGNSATREKRQKKKRAE